MLGNAITNSPAQNRMSVPVFFDFMECLPVFTMHSKIVSESWKESLFRKTKLFEDLRHDLIHIDANRKQLKADWSSEVLWSLSSLLPL